MSTKSLIWFLIILIVMVGGAYFIYTSMFGFGLAPRPAPHQDVQNLYLQRQAGDFEGVVQAYSAVAQDPSKTSTDKAVAAISSAGAEFHVTGDINDRLEDVRRLKETVVDPSIGLKTRVAAINRLASQYRDSGRDPVVFQEMFTGEPFADFLVPNDPELSARKMLEWSYAQLPTSVAAISIAKWYSERNIINTKLPADQKKAFAETTAEWLQKADTAAAEEVSNPEYLQSTNYLIYRTFKTYVVGRLARQLGEPYKAQYRKEFDEYFTFAENFDNAMAIEYILYARYTYAAQLIYDKDPEAAKVQLDTLAKEIDAFEKPYTHGFVRFLVNTNIYQRSGSNWELMPKLFAVSPNFKATVDRVIANAPKDGTVQLSEPIRDGY